MRDVLSSILQSYPLPVSLDLGKTRPAVFLDKISYYGRGWETDAGVMGFREEDTHGAEGEEVCSGKWLRDTS